MEELPVVVSLDVFGQKIRGPGGFSFCEEGGRERRMVHGQVVVRRDHVVEMIQYSKCKIRYPQLI